MKYTAILRADVEIASQSVDGCIVRRPAAGLETLPVWVEREAGTGAGRITVGAVWWSLAGLPETTLWLPHSVIGRDRPRNFVLQNGGEWRVFERCDTYGVRTPSQTLTRMSEGSLYRRATKDVEGDGLRFSFIKEADRDRDRNTANGILNPWMVGIDSTEGVKTTRGATRVMEAIRKHRADLHLDVPPEDWLRARIHTRLAERWWRNPSQQPAMPPIPALLFGTEGNAAARARAFLVLDAFKGTFIVSRRTPSGRDGERAGRNLPAPRWLASISGRDPLVSESLHALGVDPGDLRSGEEADGRTDGWRRDGIATPNNAESERLETLIAGAVQNLQDELTDLVHDDRVSQTEAKAIENVVDEARRDGAGALNPFIRRHVVPRSNFEVDLPDRPRWLDVFDKKEAEKWRAAQGAWRLDPRPDRYRSPRTWLRLVEPPGDDDMLTVPREWEATSYRWKRHFLVGLFRPGGEGDPRWIWRESGRLGVGRLGEDTSLGSPGRGGIATPEVDDSRGEVDWPAGID